MLVSNGVSFVRVLPCANSSAARMAQRFSRGNDNMKGHPARYIAIRRLIGRN